MQKKEKEFGDQFPGVTGIHDHHMEMENEELDEELYEMDDVERKGHSKWFLTIMNTFQCRSFRFGSYRVHPHKASKFIDVAFARDSIFFLLPTIYNPRKRIEVELPNEDIVQILAHFGRYLQFMFVRLTPKFAAHLRSLLQINPTDGRFIDPESKNEGVLRLIFCIRNMTDDQRQFIRDIFLEKQKLREIDQITANKIVKVLQLQQVNHPLGILNSKRGLPVSKSYSNSGNHHQIPSEKILRPLDASSVHSSANHTRKRTDLSLNSSHIINGKNSDSSCASSNNNKSSNVKPADNSAASSVNVDNFSNDDNIGRKISNEEVMNTSVISENESLPNSAENMESDDANLSCSKFMNAIQGMLENLDPGNIPDFIGATLNDMLLKSRRERHALGQVLCSLLKKETITFKLCEKGFAEKLTALKIYHLDSFPWKGLCEILHPVAEEYQFTNLFVKEILRPSRRMNTVTLRSVLFHCFVRIKNTSYAQKVCEALNINLPWNPSNVNESIDNTVPDTENSDIILFRAIVTAIHQFSLKECGSGRKEVDTTFLKEKKTFLSYCMQHNHKLELQALFAIQRLVTQEGHPDGVLHQFFTFLYENSMIRGNVFQEWEKNQDPNEVDGKEAALRSVETFLNSIKS